MEQYLFQSSRIGFRLWSDNDLTPLAQLNADPAVMKYFPSTVNESDTAKWINKQNGDYKKYGYCYYAVDLLDTHELIGFIGLSYKELDTDFSPCTDIGWRLATKFQGKGLATEGAERCLEFGFESLKLKEIVAIAPEVNLPSINVMQKIGMKFECHFEHPQLSDYPDLKKCVLYKSRYQ
ncbi:GNAT family N-acetyltransferase [Fulvivirga lutea]|uniref:GNAT family N-acetyltransferase n=1 Tax=Fulvivirga lutea TaxID=2810512 RepID=A0A975A1Z5_9BACT|nr:GNAT family N-acetyltransferase [Fulvivirga lutea]QSE98886.1 GNAT family N-acetyltransferase [Fulvivirga lutea]